MSDYNWEEVDEQYTDIRTDGVPIDEVLYGFDCPQCGAEVWSDGFDSDADSPSWGFDCHECDMRYRMYPSTVQIDGVSDE